MKRILIIEPYFTGSHRSWALELQKELSSVDLDLQILSLKGRHWKWRMEAGALELAIQFKELQIKPDLLIVSSMLDLPTFTSLSQCNCPSLLYFHENQWAYPWSVHDQEKKNNIDYHYGFLQFKSSLVAQKVLFNSQWNKDSFISGLQSFLKKTPQSNLLEALNNQVSNFSVLPLGLDLRDFDQTIKSKTSSEPRVIVWNHRWEYDKGPELFFNTLLKLKENNIDFRLIVLGEEYRKSPAIFSQAKEWFAEQTLHWGWCATRSEYVKWLQAGDILPVTSEQDFFGISACEGIAAGLSPLFPNALAFPEHIPLEEQHLFLYENAEQFYVKLKHMLTQDVAPLLNIQEKINSYSWNHMTSAYREEIKELLK